MHFCWKGRTKLLLKMGRQLQAPHWSGQVCKQVSISKCLWGFSFSWESYAQGAARGGSQRRSTIRPFHYGNNQSLNTLFQQQWYILKPMTIITTCVQSIGWPLQTLFWRPLGHTSWPSWAPSQNTHVTLAVTVTKIHEGTAWRLEAFVSSNQALSRLWVKQKFGYAFSIANLSLNMMDGCIKQSTYKLSLF